MYDNTAINGHFSIDYFLLQGDIFLLFFYWLFFTPSDIFLFHTFHSRFMYDNDTVQNTPSNWVVAMPDVKTYKETELQYICEEAQPFPPRALLDIKTDSKNSIRKSMPF